MIELNKDGLAASEGWMQHQSATFGLHWKNAKPIIEAYFDTIHESDAPALALAILEAAGAHKDSQDFLGGAVEQLRFHIGEQERVTAEARERAELEAEALELCNAHRTAVGSPTVASWDGFTSATKSNWLAVARRARELAKEATK